VGPRKKKSARELADLLADFGPAAPLLAEFTPERVSGILFHADRFRLRSTAHLTQALATALSGDVPREIFSALHDDERSAEEAYRRYQAYAALARRNPS